MRYVKSFIWWSVLLLASVQMQSQTIFLKQPQEPEKQRKSDVKPFLQDLHSDIESIISNSDFSNAFIGISVQSMETGEYFYLLNQSRNFVPASTNKIITTAAALDYLGPEFKFTTSLYLDGTISANGEFEGNIIIRGSGDPSFSSFFLDNPYSIFDAWALKLDSVGIKSIKGNLIADDRYFDNAYYPPGWALDDLIYSYSPQISSLSVNDNKVDVHLKAADKEGDLAKIWVDPQTNYIRLLNFIKTVPQNESTDYSANREIKTNIIEMNGTIAIDSTRTEESKISVSIDNPSFFFLTLLKQSLEKTNIRFRGALLNINELNQKFSYTNQTPVCNHFSPPIKEIISVVNKNSHNLIAEILLKTIAKETTGLGSFAKGIEKIRLFLSKSGISTDNINIVDGSGLSRLNFISPKYQTALLLSIYRSEYKDIFLQSLAEPGQKGTLKKRLTKSRAEKNVFAKTGSMNGVSNICGYVRTKDNEILGFSIMMNNFSVQESLARGMQDLILMRLASFSRKPE